MPAEERICRARFSRRLKDMMTSQGPSDTLRGTQGKTLAELPELAPIPEVAKDLCVTNTEFTLRNRISRRPSSLHSGGYQSNRRTSIPVPASFCLNACRFVGGL